MLCYFFGKSCSRIPSKVVQYPPIEEIRGHFSISWPRKSHTWSGAKEVKRLIKAVILAGGRGSRLSEYTDSVPKPLVEIDNFPILFHVMSVFANQGIHDFIVLTGYKGHHISDFFTNFHNRYSNLEINLGTGSIRYQIGRAHV